MESDEASIKHVCFPNRRGLELLGMSHCSLASTFHLLANCASRDLYHLQDKSLIAANIRWVA